MMPIPPDRDIVLLVGFSSADEEFVELKINN